MTQARSTQRRTILERNAAEVVAILATGETHANVARLFKVDPSAVTRFEDRHAEDIEAMRVEIEREVSQFAIAHKVNRIAMLQRLADDVTAYLDDRGLMERSVTTTKDGAEIVRERFAREVAAELRAILKDAAIEVGQRDGEGEGDKGISIRDSQVLIVRDAPPLNL